MKRVYDNPKFEQWAKKQPMRYGNGLSISDTIIQGKKPWSEPVVLLVQLRNTPGRK